MMNEENLETQPDMKPEIRPENTPAEAQPYVRQAASPVFAPEAIPMPEPKSARRGEVPFLLGFFCGLLSALSIALLLLLFFRTGVIRLPERQGETEEELLDEFTTKKIELIEETIKEQFYRTDIEKDDLREGLYYGLVDAIDDPYSVYYPADIFDEIMSGYTGIYGGIGAYLMTETGQDYPVIAGVMEGTPAEEAGLQADDVIVAVDGTSVEGLDLNTVVSRVKGEEGTVVHLTIKRGADTLEVDVTRRQISTPTVRSEDPVDGIGYIIISEFDTVTSDQFTEALAEQKAKGMKGLILDLRGNTGGDLDATCEIARQMLPAGIITYTLDRDGNREDYTCDGAHEADYPIVILVNGYSASASEVLSGALRDHGLAKLLGTTTYGKGVVQKIFSMGDGSAMKLTTESYFTPSGFDLNGIGLEPDVEVPFDADAYEADGTDNQRARAEELLKEMIKD